MFNPWDVFQAVFSCSHVPPPGGRRVVGRSNSPGVAERLAQHVEPAHQWCQCWGREAAQHCDDCGKNYERLCHPLSFHKILIYNPTDYDESAGDESFQSRGGDGESFEMFGQDHLNIVVEQKMFTCHRCWAWNVWRRPDQLSTRLSLFSPWSVTNEEDMEMVANNFLGQLWW